MTGSPLIIAVVSYLLGSIPFGYLLVRIFRGQDVRQTGSGNIGATNVARTGSKGLAIATLVLDALKGYVAVCTGISASWSGSGRSETDLPPGRARRILRSARPHVSHLAPLQGWQRSRHRPGRISRYRSNGRFGFARGVSHSSRDHALRFAGQHPFRQSFSLGRVAAQSIRPHHDDYGSNRRASSLLIIIRHKDNIRRLLAGTENRFGERGPVSKHCSDRRRCMGHGHRHSPGPRRIPTKSILWAHEPEVRESINVRHVNEFFLSGHPIPDPVTATNSFEDALRDADIVVSVMPSHHTRRVFQPMLPYLKADMLFVSATKGIENDTFLRMTEVITDVAAARSQRIPSSHRRA